MGKEALTKLGNEGWGGGEKVRELGIKRERGRRGNNVKREMKERWERERG